MRRADHDLAIDPATFADIDSLLALVGACVRHMRSQNIDQWNEAYPTHATIKADVAAGTAFVARRGSSLRLDAFTGNPRAIRLYERLGYRFAGEVCFRKGIFRCFEKHLKQPT